VAEPGDRVHDRIRDEELLIGSDIPGRRRSGRSFWWIASLLIVFCVWQLASWHYHSELIMPSPVKALIAFWHAIRDPEVLKNLAITVKRVLTGFGLAMAVGVPVGYLMGYSRRASAICDPLINTFRQVPIMAWVPLSIVWFGLGDGPTVFIIAFVGVFAVILATLSGVRSIPVDYYHAARSMGAGPWIILARVIVPATIPDLVTGARLALGAGWASVICAEFVATSAGFGFAMVRAQTKMETDMLMALMIMAALVGFAIDRGLLALGRALSGWRAER
jgi:ABC-type nitrate/sulfonate/bicarbonate transport system permease component